MLREALSAAYKDALRGRDTFSTQTLRMVLAELKSLDIAARPKGESSISDSEIFVMLQGMIKQRRESETIFRAGNRPELADKEAAECVIIERFLPTQLDAEAIEKAIDAAISETGARSLKDIRKVLDCLRAAYSGSMDFAAVGEKIRLRLGGK